MAAGDPIRVLSSQNLNPAYPSAEETMTDCVQHLKLFGYSETEARFLRLVALHSGVFLARQFNLFAQAKTGYRVDAFAKKFGVQHEAGPLIRVEKL